MGCMRQINPLLLVFALTAGKFAGFSNFSNLAAKSTASLWNWQKYSDQQEKRYFPNVMYITVFHVSANKPRFSLRSLKSGSMPQNWALATPKVVCSASTCLSLFLLASNSFWCSISNNVNVYKRLVRLVGLTCARCRKLCENCTRKCCYQGLQGILLSFYQVQKNPVLTPHHGAISRRAVVALI